MIKKIKWYLSFIWKILNNIFKGNIVFGIQFFYRINLEIIQKIIGIKYQKKLIKTTIWWEKIIIHNSLVSYLIIDEIWTEKLYSRFEWCKYILDLWWYLWESAIYFNKQIWATVDVYEPDKRNFALLSKNVIITTE